MSNPSKTPGKFIPSRSGAIVFLGLIAFGLIIVGGIYISPRARSPVAPTNIPWGVPNTQLKFIAYDLAMQHPHGDPMIEEIAKMQPDYVLLQGINEDEVVEAVELLGMQKWFHPQLYQRSERLAGRKGIWGNLILSRRPIYEAVPLGGPRGGFGEWVISVVDNKRFYVANLHLSDGVAGAGEISEFADIWRAHGSRPIVANMCPSNPHQMPEVTFLSPVPSGNEERIYVSAGWNGEATESATSDRGLHPRAVILHAVTTATTSPHP